MSPKLVISIRFEQSADQAAANAARAAQNADHATRNADQARANADRIIENAIQDAERAVNGGDPAVAPTPPSPPFPGDRPSGFVIEDGRPISFDYNDGAIFLTQDGITREIPLRDAVPREAAQIAWAVPATLSVLFIWWPLSRAVIRWLNRKNVANGEAAALEARMRDRLELLERNVDTVAVEMERLSEGQRFTNKLLADRAEQGERVPLNVPR